MNSILIMSFSRDSEERDVLSFLMKHEDRSEEPPPGPAKYQSKSPSTEKIDPKRHRRKRKGYSIRKAGKLTPYDMEWINNLAKPRNSKYKHSRTTLSRKKEKDRKIQMIRRNSVPNMALMRSRSQSPTFQRKKKKKRNRSRSMISLNVEIPPHPQVNEVMFKEERKSEGLIEIQYNEEQSPESYEMKEDDPLNDDSRLVFDPTNSTRYQWTSPKSMHLTVEPQNEDLTDGSSEMSSICRCGSLFRVILLAVATTAVFAIGFVSGHHYKCNGCTSMVEGVPEDDAVDAFCPFEED